MYTISTDTVTETTASLPQKPELSPWQIFLQFLHFGMLAWGGPIVQIAIIRSELVNKKHWIKGKKFSRALAVYQMLPGPEATKMSIYLGMKKGGRLGGLLAGLGFILPGFILTLLFAWAYKSFGASEFVALFAGIQPAVTSLIVYALAYISSHVIKRPIGYAIAAYAFASISIGVHFLIVFLVCGILFSLWVKGKKPAAIAIAITVIAAYLTYHFFTMDSPATAIAGHETKSSLAMFLASIKAGMLSFGGAYTTVPLFKASIVSNGWVTNKQLIDGLAIISMLPAPVTMLSAFLGFMAGGWWGAVLMTFGAFLPSFCIVLFGNGYVKRIIKNKSVRPFLQGMVAGVVGLFAVTAIELAITSITDWKRGLIAVTVLGVLYAIRSHFVIPVCIIGAGIVGIALL